MQVLRCELELVARDGAGAEGEARASFEIGLEPRSGYVLADEVRWKWQHSIPATKELRSSITSRTLRRGA